MVTKKLSFFICSSILLLSFIAPLNSMQVTQPYTPGMCAQYPTTTKIGTSLAVAGVAAALTVGSQKEVSSDSLKASLVVAIPVFCGSYLYQKILHKPNILDVLLTNPQSALDQIYQTRELFKNEALSQGLDKEMDTTILTQKTRNLVEKYEQKCPLLFVGECTTSYCVFTRSNNPHLRAAYETKVSALLLEKIQLNQGRVVHSAHFACGGALSDLVIVTKTLAQKPDAHVHIHLIDGNHTSYVACQDFFGNSHEIKDDQSSADNNRIQEYIDHLKTTAPNEVKDKSDEQLKKQLIESNLIDAIKYQQLIKWLHYTFPGANISLSIHSIKDNYISYIEKNNIPYADVVTTADIQDGMSLLRYSPYNYAQLCAKILQHNPSSRNIWLGHNNKDAVGLFTISLEDNGNKTKQMTFEDTPDLPTIYLSLEKL